MFELSTTCRFLACSPWRTPLLQSRQNKRNQRRFSKMEEIWKDVEGFEGFYEVSNQGAVRSLLNSRGNPRIELKILKPTKSKAQGGYLTVQLCKDGKKLRRSVHRIVAEAFIPNILGLSEVNHINENTWDNRVENLEWISHRDNCNYGTRNMRVSNWRRGRFVNDPSTSKPVLQLDLSENLVKEWPSLMEVHRQTGWSSGNISMVCNGRHKTAYGFVWRYSDDAFLATVQGTLF